VFKFRPQKDATIVTRLRNAGAVIVGKASMGDALPGSWLRLGSHSNMRPEPQRERLVRRNRSGIAANFATAGIERGYGWVDPRPCCREQPGGLRPTLPLVSRHGMFPARPTTDTLGPITRTVRDAAIVLDAIMATIPTIR
jgi:hypothetical protein